MTPDGIFEVGDKVVPAYGTMRNLVFSSNFTAGKVYTVEISTISYGLLSACMVQGDRPATRHMNDTKDGTGFIYTCGRRNGFFALYEGIVKPVKRKGMR